MLRRYLLTATFLLVLTTSAIKADDSAEFRKYIFGDRFKSLTLFSEDPYEDETTGDSGKIFVYIDGKGLVVEMFVFRGNVKWATFIIQNLFITITLNKAI